MFEIVVCNKRCPNLLCSKPILYEVNVKFDEQYPNITVSKVIAPNEVGDIRHLLIEKVENYPRNQLIIMDRTGTALLKLDDYTNAKAWDGLYKGKVLPAGAYYYIFEAKTDSNSIAPKKLKPLGGIFYLIN